MEWLARQMQVAGQRVFCMGPGDLFPLGGSLFFDVEGNPERVDIIYRFFELFDLASIRTAPFIFEAWAAATSRSPRRCAPSRRRSSRSRSSTTTC